tara:strand:+ start:318 stop:659 length:342 start_codon:yes stop_codon:yes gene_type:complete
MAKKDKKDRLKSIAKGGKSASGDYSAKGLYVKRAGLLGKNKVDTKNTVDVTDRLGRTVTYKKGQGLAGTPRNWKTYIQNAGANPALHADAIAFTWTDGKVYNLDSGTTERTKV